MRLDNSQITKLELTSKIESLIDSSNITGISIAIFNDNKTIYQKSFGYSNYENKDYLKNTSIFQSASLSKAVFAYLVAQLVDKRIIDLDRPLQEYLEKSLPDIKFKNKRRGYEDLKNDTRYKLITARMCLSHTTGFPNWRWMTKENDFIADGKIRFLIDPNTRYSYSGEGINLLQFVVEQITKKTLEELAQKYVFEPLGMSTTSYLWRNSFEDQYCNGHTSKQTVIPKDIGGLSAAGSLHTTLEDYSKFIGSILKNKLKINTLLFKPNIKIISKTQFGYQSWIDTKENDNIDLSYGLGWGLLTTPYGKGAFKEGHDNGFQHYSIIFPEKKIGILILSNSNNAESIFKDLLEIAIADIYTPWKWERYIPYNYRKD